MRSMRLLLALALFLPLAACLPGLTAKDPGPPLMVEQGETLMRLAAPAENAQGMMKLVARNGDVETWMSADRYTVSLQRGIVVATRGFGFDLMTGDAQVTLDALAMPRGAVYSRRMRYLTSDNHSTWLQAGCTMVFAEIDSGLRRFDETCRARQHSFTNRYWIDGSGRVLRSRQWVSAETGYLEIGFALQ